MGASATFWTDDSDGANGRFLAEHATVGRLAGDTFEATAGSEALLPPWPPTVNLPGISVPLSAEVELARSTCRHCGTALAEREGEWRHEVSFGERDGCMEPVP